MVALPVMAPDAGSVSIPDALTRRPPPHASLSHARSCLMLNVPDPVTTRPATPSKPTVSIFCISRKDWDTSDERVGTRAPLAQ